MKIFITGGSGFIGQFVVRKLDNGKNQLLILNRNTDNLMQYKNASFINSDLASINNWKRILKDFKPNVAIHLAWEGIPDYGPKQSIKNLNYGLNLVEFLANIGCQTFLGAGSLWEYGNQSGKLNEDAPIKSFNSFTTAKNSLHFLGRDLAKEYNMLFIWTRLFYVYGPGQKNSSLISYLINCAKKNIQPEIRNPKAQNDFVYVEDVADAIIHLLLKCKKSDVFNIGSGKLISVEEVIIKIYNSFGLKMKLKIAKKKQMDSLTSYYADISKIKKETGWKPQTNIDEGIKKTIVSI